MPQQIVDGFAQATGTGSFDFNSLTGVGDLGAAILAALPAQVAPVVQPYIGLLVEGVHGAFSLATAQAFWLGVVGSILALFAALAIKEIPLRSTNEMPVAAAAPAEAPAKATKPEPVSANTVAGD